MLISLQSYTEMFVPFKKKARLFSLSKVIKDVAGMTPPSVTTALTGVCGGRVAKRSQMAWLLLFEPGKLIVIPPFIFPLRMHYNILQ